MSPVGVVIQFDLTVQATDWTDTKPNNENLFKVLFIGTLCVLCFSL